MISWRWPASSSAERRGEVISLVCSDSDQTIRALLERFPAARDIEITGGALEDAFLALTADDAEACLVRGILYTRYELLRAIRNRRFFFFSLGFPLRLLLRDRRAEPARARTSTRAASPFRSTTWSA